MKLIKTCIWTLVSTSWDVSISNSLIYFIITVKRSSVDFKIMNGGIEQCLLLAWCSLFLQSPGPVLTIDDSFVDIDQIDINISLKQRRINEFEQLHRTKLLDSVNGRYEVAKAMLHVEKIETESQRGEVNGPQWVISTGLEIRAVHRAKHGSNFICTADLPFYRSFWTVAFVRSKILMLCFNCLRKIVTLFCLVF